MSRFDLSKAQDFRAVTLGSAAGVLQTLALAGRDPTKWDIVEGAYNSVLFHVFQSKTEYQAELPRISDRGGRRKVKYKFPYKDGQTTDDLGREPESFDIEVLFHGPRYMQGFVALKKELDKPTPGTLVHPVRGNINCVPETYEIIHESQSRMALTLRVTFTEHNFTIGDLRDFKDTSVKGALSRALDAFAFIDKAITNVLGVALFARSLKNQVNQGLTDYRNEFGKTLVNLNSIFNQNSSNDIPGLLPVNDGGNRNPDGTLANTNFQIVTSPNDSISSVNLSETTTLAIAVKNVTKQVIALRSQLADIIAQIEAGSNGLGSLEFHDDIVNLKTTGILMQDALEKGIASSQAQVIFYVVPRDMSLREVAFLNGLEVDRVTDLDLLNPDLDSTNLIFKGSTVQVPVS